MQNLKQNVIPKLESRCNSDTSVLYRYFDPMKYEQNIEFYWNFTYLTEAVQRIY